jgi:uncharacterized protein
MILRYFLLTFFSICIPLFAASAEDSHKAASGINWNDWNDQVFTRAASEKKFVILNLEAIWCHWCHVMAEKTYSQTAIQDFLNKNFLAIKVDQDSRPDLSLRYRDYGWPATIIFKSDGTELRKLAGFVEPALFLKTLEEVVKNPVPQNVEAPVELEFAKNSKLESQYAESLLNKHYNSIDLELGGLKTKHKYLDFETLEFSFLKATKNSEKDISFLKTSLNSNLKLIDPVWSGVYQYSTHSNWDNPHFEKIVPTQSNNIKLYSYAYSYFSDETYWKASTGIYTYVKNFLTSPEGAFYTSQDADVVKGQHSADYFKLSDANRKQKGIPTVDKNIYSRENGLLVQAFAALYASTSNEIIKQDAEKAAMWIINNRSILNGGFKHGDKDPSGPYLADSLSMGQGLLALYSISGDRKWLSESEKTANFIIKTFADGGSTRVPGFFSSVENSKSILKPIKNLEENTQLARYFNILKHYTGKSMYADNASLAMQYIATPAFSSGNINDSGILSADYELTHEPMHITIVGSKSDPASKALFLAGLKHFSTYKRLEWWDKSEGPMPNPDVEYPQMPKAAAFVCTNKRCSLPIFDPQKISETIKILHKE